MPVGVYKSYNGVRFLHSHCTRPDNAFQKEPDRPRVLTPSETPDEKRDCPVRGMPRVEIREAPRFNGDGSRNCVARAATRRAGCQASALPITRWPRRFYPAHGEMPVKVSGVESGKFRPGGRFGVPVSGTPHGSNFFNFGRSPDEAGEWPASGVSVAERQLLHNSHTVEFLFPLQKRFRGMPRNWFIARLPPDSGGHRKRTSTAGGLFRWTFNPSFHLPFRSALMGT